MVTSGETAIATSGNTAVDAIARSSMKGGERNFRIINSGTVAGFFSTDEGTTWNYMPGTAASTNPIPIQVLNVSGLASIKIKRIAGGTDLAGVYASAWA